jgi:hypothetical protein
LEHYGGFYRGSARCAPHALHEFRGPLPDQSKYVIYWRENFVSITVTGSDDAEDEAGIGRETAHSQWVLDEDAEDLDKVGSRVVVGALIQGTHGTFTDGHGNDVGADLMWGV